EPDVLDGLWFEPDPADETAVDVTLPTANLLPEAASIAHLERLPAFGVPPALARMWTARGRGPIAAAAGGVLGGLALMLLFTHGRSADRVGSPQPTATVR